MSLRSLPHLKKAVDLAPRGASSLMQRLLHSSDGASGTSEDVGLPQSDNHPTGALELASLPSVSIDVVPDLWDPIVCVRAPIQA